MELICNTSFDEIAWTQATLPVSMSILGIRSIQNICFSAYLSSNNMLMSQIKEIIPSRIFDTGDEVMNEALAGWTSFSGSLPIEQQLAGSQKS